MATEYRIKAGYLVITETVSGAGFDVQGNVTAATLQGVRDIFTGDAGIDGNDDAAKLQTLKEVWDFERGPGDTAVTDIEQRNKIGKIRRTSSLITPDLTSTDNSNTNTYHKTSNVNVLPPGFSQAWKALTRTQADVGIEKTRTILKALEGTFTDIKPYDNADDAYAAYNEWLVSGQGDTATKEARLGYLVNG